MNTQELGDYLKSKAKSSGDFIPIHLPNAYLTLNVLTHFFFQKKHEWIAICFLDDDFQCHVMWIEKGINNIHVSPSLSISKAVKFAQINNFRNIILSHNHVVTSKDVSFFKSHGINIYSSQKMKRQQFLRFSEGDKNYSKLYLKQCNQAGIGFGLSVVVGYDFKVEGHQRILNNISSNKPVLSLFRSKARNFKVSGLKQPISSRKIIYKTDDKISKSTEHKGLIGYYGLSNWWNRNFTLEEQNYIASHFNETYNKDYDIDNMEVLKNRKLNGLSDCILTETEIQFWSDSLLQFATSLIVGFNNKRNRELSLKILEKAEELINNSIAVLDLHFFFEKKIGINYSLRDLNEKYKENAIEACKQQIGISQKASNAFRNIGSDGFIPSHTGYKRMAIIKEKKGKFQEVIDLCQEVQEEGWNGDWQKRIDRCKKKLSKS